MTPPARPAQLVDEESTRTVMAALKEVVEKKWRFCALYSDRASHFFETPKGGGPVDRSRHPGGAGVEGIEHPDDPGVFAASAGAERAAVWDLAGALAAGAGARWDHHPGGVEPLFTGTLHSGDEPQVCGAGSGAGPRLCAGPGSRFGPDLFGADGADNTVGVGERLGQIERTRWRGTLAGCRVTICEHLDGRVSILYGPHVVGRYTAHGVPLRKGAEGGRRGTGRLKEIAF